MTGRFLGTVIAAGLLIGCGSAPRVGPMRVYDGRVHLSEGRVSWSCPGRERERVRFAFRDRDDDGRWDDDEPATLERRCVAPAERARPPTAAPSRSGPSVHVPSRIALDESNHLDTFTFESGAGVVVIRDARDRPERVTGVTELSLYTNVVIVRTRGGAGRIVPAERFVRAEWVGEDEGDG
ncbi:MAG TPA: hypothetical protein RMH99_04020 [Sandaracinaceae bacterium LLY-WYZ-13_1]|nr:hypothetical protein [Sandaracinaceae bacterium LLY-WYZ-13_1]